MRQIPIGTVDKISLTAANSNGDNISPSKFDAPPVWANSDDTVATLNVAADGLTAVLSPSKLDGVTTVTVTGNIGAAVFIGSVDYSVISGSGGSISLIDQFIAK